MSKAIRSFPKPEQGAVVARRAASESKGLGYWAAVDAQVKVLREALIAKGLIKPLDK